jgi:hypothetical protein
MDTTSFGTSFGFVMTRHVNSEKTNHYWQEAYRCIREIYPDVGVLIIDDNSCKEYVKILPETPVLSNVWFIQSEFPGRGELLAYYYFWKLRPFKTAFIMHDSVFLQPPFRKFMSSKWDEIQKVRFLWHFPHFFDEPAKEEPFLRALEKKGKCSNNIGDVIYFHKGMWDEWLGCFGVMSVIHHEFLSFLVEKYSFFDWFTMVFSRNERYIIERVFAVLCCIEYRDAKKSLFGDIYETPRNYQFDWNAYMNMEWTKDESMSKLPVLKVWSGR